MDVTEKIGFGDGVVEYTESLRTLEENTASGYICALSGVDRIGRIKRFDERGWYDMSHCLETSKGIKFFFSLTTLMMNTIVGLSNPL